MKINLRMIGEKLENYHPEFHITDGSRQISGVRMWSEEPDFMPENQYVYLEQDGHTARLRNGDDSILLNTTNTSRLLNDLMAIFEYYNIWETSLLEASVRHSPQQIIDLAQPMFGNPMTLSDMSGNVLAMSSAYLDVPVSKNWMEARDTQRMPISTVGSPLLTLDGKSGNWSPEPKVHTAIDNMRALGMQICTERQPTAVLVVLEHGRPLTRSDQDLLVVVAGVLATVLENQTDGQIFHSPTNLIEQILRGDLSDPELIQQLDFGHRPPWRLILADSPYRSDFVSKRNLLQRLPNDGVPGISFLYGSYVVTLLSDEWMPDLLRRAPTDGEGRFWQIAISLPFSNLVHLRPIYDLAAYTMTRTAGTAGQYHCEDYAFQHMLSRFRENIPAESLLHPALTLLKQQDQKKDGQLYETLYQYLFHERSIQAGADAMYVHKNSFLYRLQRARELTGVNLDDPMTRAYLLFSFLLDHQ